MFDKPALIQTNFVYFAALPQVKKYLEAIGNATLPAFLVHNLDVYVLQSYGWQKFDIKDFPKLQKLQ